MFQLFSEARIIPILSGTLKRIPLMKHVLPKKTGGSVNARYCYSVWLRHLFHLALFNGNKIPARIAELGPGDSLGIGLAALLSGSEQYYALDVIKFWNLKRNLEILTDLQALFNSRADIPDNDEFPNVFPLLDDYSFPSKILTEEILRKSLNPERLEKIRGELMSGDDSSNKIIKFRVPWSDTGVIDEGSVDLILSQAVMGQVDELEKAYASMNTWLAESGFISHTIDLTSHGFTKRWNGHWTLSEFEWKVVRGGRIYAINRFPVSKHKELLGINNFSILYENALISSSTIGKEDLARQYHDMTNDDLVTSGVFFVAKKYSPEPDNQSIV